MSSIDLIRALEDELASAPDNLALRKRLASLLAGVGRYQEAVQHYRRALDLAPNDADLKLALAEAYTGQGKEDVALVVLEDLMRAKTVPPKALLLAARLYLKTGQQQEAVGAYAHAVTADPALADAELAAALGFAPGETTPDEQPADKNTRVVPPSNSQPPQKKKELVFVVGKDEPGASSLYEIERPRIGFDDVGGMEKLKEEIRMKIIYPLTQPGLVRAHSKGAGGGILMYGPPGCGKTHLARATAGEVQASFLSIGLHDVMDMYTGQSERSLHQVFELAREEAPCLLFFDEIDALGGSRAGRRDDAMRQVINQLLAEMEGVDASNEGVLILAATNTPWYVDQELRRPGGFDRVLFIPPPDVLARDAILHLLLRDKPTAQIDFNHLAHETREFSGADLKGAVDLALEQNLAVAMRSGSILPLTTTDLLDAIHQQRPTTAEWFETARNFAVNANEGGLYDDMLAYLKMKKG